MTLSKPITSKEWEKIKESIEQESCDVGIENLTELWIDTQMNYVEKEGRETALECGYLVEDEEE